MYFSYMRGRQYELLAVRELAEKKLIGDKVLPIIEPVKLTSTLYKTLEACIENGVKVGIVCNPIVGSFLPDDEENEEISEKKKYFDMVKKPEIAKVLLMREDTEEQVAAWEDAEVSKREWIVISDERDYIEDYKYIFLDESPQYTLLPDDFRRKIRGIRTNKVLFEDHFTKREKNADYAKKPDEFFSEDHLFYREETYEGFADYSIIGKDYVEAGFAPRAVAIHIVYFAEDDSLRIKHFVSDSNEGIENPAGKFYEAVKKLYQWTKETKPVETEGLRLLCKHYEEGTYPGLGSIKKMSLMHHLELMSRYLDGVK